MLRTRIMTAAVIALVAFCLLFLTPPAGFRLFFALLFMVGAWEFARLADLGAIGRGLLLALQAVIFVLLLQYWPALSGHALALLAAGCLSWCLMLLRLVTFRAGNPPGINYRLTSFFCALAGSSFCWIALAWLRDQPRGEFLVLLLLLIIWAADIGAYFAGHRFGRHRLAPQISPCKTREGLLGGILLAAAVAWLYGRAAGFLPGPVSASLALTTITVLASAGGDLFISIHKRTVGLKDSGRLFPGHGGVLDRFDSLLAGAPFFALGWLLFSR